MASINNIQGTMNWCASFLKFMPQNIGSNEPALTTANMVAQTIMGPPFCWRWNRNTATFTCNASTHTQDYTQAVSDFGFIEKAWVQLPSGTQDIKEMEVKTVLGLTIKQGRPMHIAAQNDDNAGNITFRVMDAPDVAYPATVVYQKKAQLMLSLASSWGPIPDEDSYIYNWGFLTVMGILTNDPRFPIWNQKFIGHLLGAQDGLDEMAKNLFLGTWMDVTKRMQREAEKVKAGVSGRSL